MDNLVDAYDETYENFFKRKESLMLNIHKLSELKHGKDVEKHKEMTQGAHSLLTRTSEKLVEKRNNFLKENIAHWDEDQ